MIDLRTGDRVRVTSVDPHGDLRIKTGLGTVLFLDDVVGAGFEQVVVALDDDAYVWELPGGRYAYSPDPKNPHVFDPSRLEKVG